MCKGRLSHFPRRTRSIHTRSHSTETLLIYVHLQSHHIPLSAQRQRVHYTTIVSNTLCLTPGSSQHIFHSSAMYVSVTTNLPVVGPNLVPLHEDHSPRRALGYYEVLQSLHSHSSAQHPSHSWHAGVSPVGGTRSNDHNKVH